MQFQPGQSGNPGGRPKEAEKVKALARVHTEEAINTLVVCMRIGDTLKDRAFGSIALLDRAWGKPAQAIAGPDGDEPLKMVIEWAKPGG